MSNEPGSVFSRMREKDPELFGRVEQLPPTLAMERWIETYPEDFPNRGMTSVDDLSAVKMDGDVA